MFLMMSFGEGWSTVDAGYLLPHVLEGLKE